MRGSDLYNASLSAQTAATNLSSSLKQHQLQQQQQQLTSKLLNKETDQLMEIEKLRKKLEDTEKAMAKLIAEMNSDQYEAKVRDFGKRFLLSVYHLCFYFLFYQIIYFVLIISQFFSFCTYDILKQTQSTIHSFQIQTYTLH